jgi:hypothetical protein
LIFDQSLHLSNAWQGRIKFARHTLCWLIPIIDSSLDSAYRCYYLEEK